MPEHAAGSAVKLKYRDRSSYCIFYTKSCNFLEDFMIGNSRGPVDRLQT